MNEETDHLDLLHHVVASDENVRVRVPVGAERQNCRGNVKRDSVADDHPFRPPENPITTFAADDQMQARPEHQTLPGDHRVPANREQDNGDPAQVSRGKIVEFQEEAERVGYDTDTRDKQGPVVEPTIPSESQADHRDQFDSIVHC